MASPKRVDTITHWEKPTSLLCSGWYQKYLTYQSWCELEAARINARSGDGVPLLRIVHHKTDGRIALSMEHPEAQNV